MVTDPGHDHRFPRTKRVRRQSDFDRVYQSDAFAADDVLVIRACRNGLSHSRLGLSVSRRVGNAVVRNRWKRLIRESFRLQQSRLPIGLDLVIRPRKGATPVFAQIYKSLPRLARKIDRRLPVLPDTNSEDSVEAQT